MATKCQVSVLVKSVNCACRKRPLPRLATRETELTVVVRADCARANESMFDPSFERALYTCLRTNFVPPTSDRHERCVGIAHATTILK